MTDAQKAQLLKKHLFKCEEATEGFIDKVTEYNKLGQDVEAAKSNYQKAREHLESFEEPLKKGQQELQELQTQKIRNCLAYAWALHPNLVARTGKKGDFNYHMKTVKVKIADDVEDCLYENWKGEEVTATMNGFDFIADTQSVTLHCSSEKPLNADQNNLLTQARVNIHHLSPIAEEKAAPLSVSYKKPAIVAGITEEAQAQIDAKNAAKEKASEPVAELEEVRV